MTESAVRPKWELTWLLIFAWVALSTLITLHQFHRWPFRAVKAPAVSAVGTIGATTAPVSTMVTCIADSKGVTEKTIYITTSAATTATIKECSVNGGPGATTAAP